MRTILALAMVLYTFTAAIYIVLGQDVNNADFDGWSRCVVARFHPLPKKTRSHEWDPKSGWYVEVDKGGHK